MRESDCSPGVRSPESEPQNLFHPAQDFSATGRWRWMAGALLPLFAACAAEKVALSEVATPEVIVETLPSGAAVTGAASEPGTTPYALHAARAEQRYEITVASKGFLPQTIAVQGEEIRAHPGARLLLPLRPDFWNPSAPFIDPQDAASLNRAGQDLSKANRCPEALLFLQRATEINPRFATALKAMGRCHARLKSWQKALAAYQQYLLVAPDAPDGDEVRALISKAAGDIDLPAPPREAGNSR